MENPRYKIDEPTPSTIVKAGGVECFVPLIVHYQNNPNRVGYYSCDNMYGDIRNEPTINTAENNRHLFYSYDKAKDELKKNTWEESYLLVTLMVI